MIVILTGAGISQESGISVFRGQGGLWEQEPIEEVATRSALLQNPGKVLEFYSKRLREIQEAGIEPNAAHYALARLERELDETVLVVTQNVDDLHERAGTQNLLHMHGELRKARCTGCGKIRVWEGPLGLNDACPSCGKCGKLRPHIVLFEEAPLYLDEIDEALRRCRLFVSIGTSGSVYPAAGFAYTARDAGAQVMELNLEPSMGAGVFHEGRYGRATELVPRWVEELLGA